MIQTLILSGTPSLEPLLAATLASDIRVHVEPDQAKVFNLISRKEADVVIVDLDDRFAPLEEQLATISDLQTTGVPVMVLTDDDSRSTALELLERGVHNQFLKPPSPIEMSVMIRRAHKLTQLQRELQDARRPVVGATRCDRLIGQSEKMLAVYDLIRRVADIDSGILITGESGTGKELVACAIHNLGSRASKPFVAVSCGAIPETLIEAELFGHEKGAFTGAMGARQGLLEKAADGTLFLDEIGELTPMTQVKLLRVLQQKEFTRVGGTRLIPLRARVIYATHRNLAQMVEEGTFRRDLFFRINVMQISVPPLRERPEDIPLLAAEFLRLHAGACRKQMSGIEPRAMRQLMSHDYSGNVRELENIIHRAVIVAESAHITCSDLPDFLRPTQALKQDAEPSSFEDRLRRFKWEITQEALRQAKGNKTVAASSLSISRAYLHRLIQLGQDDDVESEVA